LPQSNRTFTADVAFLNAFCTNLMQDPTQPCWDNPYMSQHLDQWRQDHELLGTADGADFFSCYQHSSKWSNNNTATPGIP
jgi:hypothetical protein